MTDQDKPKKRKPRSSKFKKMAARSGAKPILPQAGIFEPGDLDALEAAWLRLDREQFKRDREERKPLVVTRQGTQETIGNTTRYRQVPGTSRIFGGRNG